MTSRNTTAARLKVSVVIPVCSEAKIIGKCLRALTNQTVPPLEIIVVDNNSVDDTVKIAKHYKSVRIMKESRQGVAYARSMGFDAAKGDIIGRIDADTIVATGWVDSVEQQFTKDGELVAVGGIAGSVELSPPGKFWGRFLQKLVQKSDQKNYGAIHLYGSNMALRKSAWLKAKPTLCIGGNDEVLEDLDISLALASVGKTKITPELVANVHMLRNLNIRKFLKYRKLGNATLQRRKKTSQ